MPSKFYYTPLSDGNPAICAHYTNSSKTPLHPMCPFPPQSAIGNTVTTPPNAADNAASNTAMPIGTTAVSLENPAMPLSDAGIPLNAAAP